MNTVCTSTYLYLQFLSSVSYNFLSTGLLHPWLGLFLGILFFLMQLWIWLFFNFFLSVISLLAYKNATDLWVLILYPATMLNSFISCGSFLVGSLGFSMYSIMSPANNDSFTSSFPIWIPFISSCLLAVTRTSICWIREVKADILVLIVTNHEGNACSFWL